MTNCLHINCGNEKRAWLAVNHFHSSDVKLHHWCIKCGIVKNISGEKFYKFGYWMNILSKIAKHYSFTQVQKRSIAKELASHELFNDNYIIDGSSQRIIFINIVIKYCAINKKCIESFIY